MDSNDKGTGTNAGEDKTSVNNDDVQVGDELLENLDEDSKKKVQTLSAQRNHWKESAIDPETGKKYKDLVAELKSQSESKEDKTSKNDKKEDKTDNTELLQRLDNLSLRSAGIKDQDEVELAQDFKKRTGMEMDEVIQDDIFLARLEKLQQDKKTADATSGIEGGGSTSGAKETAEYWLAKGTPPTPEDVPNAKARRKITRAFVDKGRKTGVSFYNE